MKKQNLFFILFIIVSCNTSLRMMQKNSNSVQIKVNEFNRTDSLISLNFRITIPEKYFNKNAFVVFTPEIVFVNGDKIEFYSQAFEGEKIPDNCFIIPYKTGGSYIYSDTIYSKSADDIKSAYVKISAYLRKKTKHLDSIEIISPINVKSSKSF